MCSIVIVGQQATRSLFGTKFAFDSMAKQTVFQEYVEE